MKVRQSSCKRFRPLAPHYSTHDLKASPTRSSTQVGSQPGGTRWNPTTEQIGILEMVYRGGMRTPNSQQIEQIALQLSKFGKIEGKNVFYWFQNHKARERQKQKRNSLGSSPLKRKSRSRSRSRSWAFECLEDENRRSCKELELFPLHPESR